MKLVNTIKAQATYTVELSQLEVDILRCVTGGLFCTDPVTGATAIKLFNAFSAISLATSNDYSGGCTIAKDLTK